MTQQAVKVDASHELKPCIDSLGSYKIITRNDRKNDEEMEEKLPGGFSDSGFSIVFAHQQRQKPASDFLVLYDLFSKMNHIGPFRKT